MPKLPTWLRKLRVKEISLVDAGANHGARVKLAKRDDSGTADEAEVDKGLDFTQALTMDQMYTYTSALSTAIRSGFESGDIEQGLAALDVALLEFRGAIRDKLSVDKHFTPDAGDPGDTTTEKGASMKTCPDCGAKVKDGVSECPDCGVKMKKGATEDGEQDLLSALPEPLRKRFQALESVEKKNADLTSLVQKMVEKDAEREAVAKAKTLAGATGIDPVKIAKLLRSLPEGEVATLEEVLAKANEHAQLSKAFDELGTAAGIDVDAASDVNKAIDAEMKADPKLSRSQAITKALTKNPELYEQLEEEREDALAVE